MAVGAILGQKPQIPQPVDTVQQGNMNAVTSNAVYEAIQGIVTGLNAEMGSYVGDGTNLKTINFNKEPVVFYLYKYHFTNSLQKYCYGFKGMDGLVVFEANVTGAQIQKIYVTWNENSITLQESEENFNYIYLALTK